MTVAPGLQLWSDVEVYAYDHKGYDVVVRVLADGTRMWANEVRVTQRDGGPPVTGEALRQVTVAAFVRLAVRAGAVIGKEPWAPESERLMYGHLDAKHRDLLREAGPVRETLEWVARAYRLAMAMGERPTKYVEEVFEVPRYTASRWIASARGQGLLGPAEPGKAGG
ncbi:MAG: hypothetical protein JWP40_969 [Blastococcus sp.]|nr:hypothetical protein [Blastococcus sp.]